MLSNCSDARTTAWGEFLLATGYLPLPYLVSFLYLILCGRSASVPSRR